MGYTILYALKSYKVLKEAKRQATEDPIFIKEWFNALGRDIKKYIVQHEKIYNINKLGIYIE